MKSLINTAGCCLLALTLVACSNMNKQDVGAVTGGILGGVLGNQIGGGTGRVIATIGGTLAGAYLGGAIGASMDKTDQLAVNQALETTPTNQRYNWANPDTHNKYSVKPIKTYYQKTNEGHRVPCRTFVTTAIINGKAEKIKGRACRDRHGNWQTATDG